MSRAATGPQTRDPTGSAAWRTAAVGWLSGAYRCSTRARLHIGPAPRDAMTTFGQHGWPGNQTATSHWQIRLLQGGKRAFLMRVTRPRGLPVDRAVQHRGGASPARPLWPIEAATSTAPRSPADRRTRHLRHGVRALRTDAFHAYDPGRVRVLRMPAVDASGHLCRNTAVDTTNGRLTWPASTALPVPEHRSEAE